MCSSFPHQRRDHPSPPVTPLFLYKPHGIIDEEMKRTRLIASVLVGYHILYSLFYVLFNKPLFFNRTVWCFPPSPFPLSIDSTCLLTISFSFVSNPNLIPIVASSRRTSSHPRLFLVFTGLNHETHPTEYIYMGNVRLN